MIFIIVACLLGPLTASTVSAHGVMSIELGSEYMKVGLVAPNHPMDIVLNAQSQRKTAMAVAFSNGQRILGDLALDVSSKFPEKCYTHFLDLIGKPVDDDAVLQYKKRFPFANISSHEPNSSSIVLNHPDGLKLTPLELVAMMIEYAHDLVGERVSEPIRDAVIAVPLFFDAKERKIIQDAAKLVGLNVLKFTNSNSAFALSYGIFRHKNYEPEGADNVTTLFFFDQGASQTSATLADYHLVEQIDPVTKDKTGESLPTVTIRAQVYDKTLGGFDMQLRLRDYLVKSFCEETKIDENRIRNRGRSIGKLLKEAGRVKKVLSANNDHTARAENVIDDKDLGIRVTRKEYEELNDDLMQSRVTQLLDELFMMPGVSRNENMESIMIVGGNSRTPKIQQVLLDYFKVGNLGKSINADEAAAMAALYQAADIGRGFRVKKFMLEEFGDEKIRYDPALVVTTTTTLAPEIDPSTTTLDTSSTSEEPTTTPQPEQTTPDPSAIYDKIQLNESRRKLARMREDDFERLERSSLRNTLETLLVETEFEDPLLSETRVWVEDGPDQERDNITLLALKVDAVRQLIFSKTTTTTTTTTTTSTTTTPTTTPTDANIPEPTNDVTSTVSPIHSEL